MANKRDRDKLRNRVKTALERSGLTQKDLETSAGWSAGTLSRIFSGKKKPDAALLETLADRLGAPASELFAGTEFADLLKDEPTLESAPERTAESAPPRVVAPESDAPRVSDPAPEPEPEPTPSPPATSSPEVELAPTPAAEPTPPPADRGPRPEWTPPPEPRKRKRDLPFRLTRWITGLVFGD